MSLTPVILVGPTTDYVNLSLADNTGCLGLFSGYGEPTDYLTSIVDCSGAEEYPYTIVGSVPKKGRLYSTDVPLADRAQIALPAKKRVVLDFGEVWSMNGNIPAGCEPVSTAPYTPGTLHLSAESRTACGVDVDDYRLIEDAWHSATHQSAIDVVCVQDGEETARVGVASFVYSSMPVPGVTLVHDKTRDRYGFKLWAKELAGSGETATFQLSTASASDYSDETIDEWGGLTRDGDYYYSTSDAYCYRALTQYHRFRCVIRSGGSIVRTTAWFAWHLDADTMDPRDGLGGGEWTTLVDDGTTKVERCWWNDYSGNYWHIYLSGQQTLQPQDATCIRWQWSAASDFGSGVTDTVATLTWTADGHAGTDYHLLFAFRGIQSYDTLHYVRARYENSDGSVVGPWSNVFTLDPNDPASVSNWSNNLSYATAEHGAVSPDFDHETHFTGTSSDYSVASMPVCVDGTVYALVMERIRDYSTYPNTWYGAMHLLTCDGETATLTQIVEDVEDWVPMGSVVCDLAVVGGKVYAGWSNPADSVANLYDWCEVTGGVIGTVHHVARPAAAPDYENWATMAVIYGDLRVVASLDTGTEYIMGIADILSATPAMVVYPDIKTGYAFTKDPWLGSLWFDYENYDRTENAICWLGAEAAVSSFPWLGKFQLCHAGGAA